MKILLAIVAAALILAILFQARPAFPQTEFIVSCEGGVCQIREADLEKLQYLIDTLVNRILDLQAKTGCS